MSSEDLPPVDLPSLLTILGDAVSKEVLVALRGSGLRHGHGYVVQRLLVSPATATEIAAELGISQQAVSKSLKELAATGHVESTSDPADNRRRPVRLTAKGRRAVAAARAARKRIDQRIRRAIGDAGFDRMQSDLTAVLRVFELEDAVQARTVPPPTPDL